MKDRSRIDVLKTKLLIAPFCDICPVNALTVSEVRPTLSIQDFGALKELRQAASVLRVYSLDYVVGVDRRVEADKREQTGTDPMRKEKGNSRR